MSGDRKRDQYQMRNSTGSLEGGAPMQQDFIEELASRVQTLQSTNFALMGQMANAAKLLNTAIIENQILKAELQALDIAGQPPTDLGHR